MREFASEGTVSMSEIFPVITMCDVDLRALGKSHILTEQTEIRSIRIYKFLYKLTEIS